MIRTAVRRGAALLACLCASACGTGGLEEYFPLGEGLVWEYRMTVRIMNEPKSQKFVVANLGPTRLDGVDVAQQRVQQDDISYFRRTKSGVLRVAVRRAGAVEPVGVGTEHLVLPAALTPGARWPLESRLRLVESRTFAREDRLAPRYLAVTLEYTVGAVDEFVVVPAGRYRHCVRIDARGRTRVPVDRGNASAYVSVMHSDWYAPGVGLVKSVRKESTDSVFLHSGEFDLELERHGD
jgi:hypothetical protein